MTLKIATWNINSVRLRIGLVERFLEEVAPDILCLQEIKCEENQFPYKAIEAAGYGHIHVRGQKGYHGVATISRHPFAAQVSKQFCGKDDARHVLSTIERPGGLVNVHNFYVPAGGDEPDPKVNEKFDHKLKFLREMKGWFGNGGADSRSILVGDLNIAPHENDVWSHKQLLKVVSHTPIEVEHLEDVRKSADWVDITRNGLGDDDKLYTWWSYRARDWSKADKGRRLDHIWITPDIEQAYASVEVRRDVRGWDPKPSDHAPVIAKLDL